MNRKSQIYDILSEYRPSDSNKFFGYLGKIGLILAIIIGIGGIILLISRPHQNSASKILEDAIKNDSSQLMQQAIEMSGYKASFYASVGDHYFKQNKIDTALENYNQAISKDGGNAYYIYGRSMCYLAYSFNFQYKKCDKWWEDLSASLKGNSVQVGGSTYEIANYKWHEDWRGNAMKEFRTAYNTTKSNKWKTRIAESIGYLEKKKPLKRHYRYYLDGDRKSFSQIEVNKNRIKH